MSRLEIPSLDGHDSKKLVFSLWFRIPAESLEATQAEWAAWDGNWETRKPLTGILPLVVFGPPAKQKMTDFVPKTIGQFEGFANVNWTDGFGAPDCINSGWVVSHETGPQPFQISTWIENEETRPLDPSYIGIDVTGPYPALSVNIVMPDTDVPYVSGLWSQQESFSISGVVPSFAGGGICPGAPDTFVGAFGLQMRVVTNSPISSVLSQTNIFSGQSVLIPTRPEMFRTLPSARVGDSAGVGFFNDIADGGFGGQRVTPDHWHHLLLSIDLSNGVSTKGAQVTETRNLDPMTGLTSGTTSGEGATIPGQGSRTQSACKMWISFDDVNLTGENLSAYYPHGYGDPNGVVTVTGLFTATDTTFNVSDHVYDINGTDNRTYQIWEAPTYTYVPSAIPFGSSPIGIPTQAEQTDAFKVVEMADLQIFVNKTLNTSSVSARRAFISNDGKPVSPKKAEDLLGKPVILLHGSGNWIKGKNTGSDDTPIHPSGEIVRYSPPPSLHGDQSPKR
jgi:hypothetical protein